jgi:hypothetical protein
LGGVEPRPHRVDDIAIIGEERNLRLQRDCKPAIVGNAGIVLRDEAGAELGLELRQFRLQIADRLRREEPVLDAVDDHGVKTCSKVVNIWLTVVSTRALAV